MSTKAIREALEHLRDNEAYGPGAESIAALANAGLAELEAIEKAAEVVDDCYVPLEPYRRSESVREAGRVMRAVGEAAKARRFGKETKR